MNLLTRIKNAASAFNETRLTGAVARYYESDHNANWIDIESSADSDTLPYLPKLRGRARDLERTDPLAVSLTNTRVKKVVGTGIRPTPQIDGAALGITAEKEIRAIERAIDQGVKRWSKNADSTGRQDFGGLQRLAKRTREVSGEAFLLRRSNGSWELIEPDRIQSPLNQQGNIRDGIEFGRGGKPRAYWILKTHPNDIYAAFGNRVVDEFKRVRAFDLDGRPNVLHIFEQIRPEQSHGVPRFAPSLEAFRDLGKYLEAERVRKFVEACTVGVITTPEPAKVSEGDKKSERLTKMSPGRYEYLDPEQEIEFNSPSASGQSLQIFIDEMTNSISAGADISPQTATHNGKRESFSHAKSRNMTENDQWKMEQAELVRQMCQPMYEIVVEQLFLAGELPIDNFYEFQEVYTKAVWHGDVPRELEPLKAAQADALMVEVGLISRTQLYASHGLRYEDVIEELAREQEVAKKAGIVFKAAPAVPDEEVVKSDE